MEINIESLITRLFNNITIEINECWIWQKSVIKNGGYGQIGFTDFNGKRRVLYTHKVSYEYFNGPLKKGLELKHICNNHLCINPDHMIVGSRKDFLLTNKNHFIAKQAAQTHCINGHIFSVENTFWYGKNTNQRMCKICAKIRKLKDHHRRKHDPYYILVRRLRGRLRGLLRIKNLKKLATAKELIGCTPEFLKQHLESKFYCNKETGEMMTWNNIFKWDLDHIIPVSKFNLALLEEQQKCFHYTNLQPLWIKDNRLKSNK